MTLDATTASKVTDVAGNALDGEWTNPTSFSDTSSSISTYPSGNGTPGGDFTFNITVSAGDASRNGGVAIDDLATVVNNLGKPGTWTWSGGDFTGNLGVDIGDLAAVVNNMGTSFITWPTGGEMLMAGGGSGESSSESLSALRRRALDHLAAHGLLTDELLKQIIWLDEIE